MYVYDAGLNLIACNDDFYFGAPCFVYSSKLENVNLAAGGTYYIIVDGYGNASGAYIMDITGFVPCVIPCPAGGYPEGEPPLVPDYTDNYNGGCNTGLPVPDLTLSSSRCRPAARHPLRRERLVHVPGQPVVTRLVHPDTGPMGIIEITADAEAAYIFELSPQDCANVGVAQQATAGPCLETFMTIVGPANTPVWFWVGPTVFAPPPGGDPMYDYVVWFDYGVIATEGTTWGTLKALYE